ncbi:MAG: thermosome subunit beta [Candidatus Thorarchaeota archaeon SMTZ1-45]|nr:MAG: thermosome subunit [Candidatus Thorarchaeota archaeon SMTZ1-45]
MAQLSGTPILILKEGTSRTRGRSAQSNNIMAGIVISDAVKSTLGPRGMDKMLVDSLGDVTITNDGASILKEIDVQHPAAKMLVEVAKSQDQETGDGTTTSVVIAGELLKRAQDLLEKKIHPTIIVGGYQKAADQATKILSDIAVSMEGMDKKILTSIASTSMNSKSVVGSKDLFAKIAVDAILQIVERTDGEIKADIEMIEIIKKQGKSLTETELVKGMVVDKEVVHASMPRRLEKAKIALVNAAIEVEKTEFDAEIKIDSPEQIKAFLDEEEKMLTRMVDKIVATGANVLVCQKGIDDVAQHYLAKAGIMAMRRAKKSTLEKLAKATGGKIATSLDELDADYLGAAGIVEEVKIGDDKLVYVKDCKDPKAVSIVIRGGTEHVVDEADRAMHDALCVVRNVVEDTTYVAGGGSVEAEIAKRLEAYANKVGGREQLAIEAFAESLRVVPKTLAENGGHDPIDIIADLNKDHSKETGIWFGVDVMKGTTTDMMKASVIEPARVKSQAIRSAAEAAQMILRIDDVIAAKASSGPPAGAEGMGGMPPGGMGGMGGMPGMM